MRTANRSLAFPEVLLFSLLLLARGESVLGSSSSSSVSPGAITLCKAEDLRKMEANANGVFVLGCDIDLSGISWTPIAKFSGTLDGDGHTIRGLNSLSPKAKAGFFATLQGATIQNIKFVEANLVGTTSAGIVAAEAVRSVFDSVFVSGVVKGMPSKGSNALEVRSEAGGVVGNSGDGGTVMKNVTAVVSVQGANYVGGVVGDGYLEISGSSVKGSLSGLRAVGGLIGRARGAIISSSSSSGSVSLSESFDPSLVPDSPDIYFSLAGTPKTFRAAGGLVGVLHNGYADQAAVVNQSFSSASVDIKSNIPVAGGLIGLTLNPAMDGVGIKVSKSFATGKVHALAATQLQNFGDSKWTYGVGAYVGGLIGAFRANGSIEDVFTTNEVQLELNDPKAFSLKFRPKTNWAMTKDVVCLVPAGKADCRSIVESGDKVYFNDYNFFAAGITGYGSFYKSNLLRAHTLSRMTGAKLSVDGSITGSRDFYVVPSTDVGPSLVDSYFNRLIMGLEIGSYDFGYAKSLPLASLPLEESYKNWDFRDTWIMKEKGAYPVLRGFENDSGVNTPPLAFSLNFTTAPKTKLKRSLDGRDSETPASLEYRILSQPKYGTLDVQEDGSFTYKSTGTNNSVTEAIRYQVFDGQYLSPEAVLQIAISK